LAGAPDGLRTSRHRPEDIGMICRMSSGRLLTGFLERLALLRDGQNNFSALVIILFANNYGHDIEEGAAHEKI
jgi:hypothetical protein